MKPRSIKIGLLGCGTVGRGLVDLVNRNRDRIARRSGVRLEVAKVLVRDLSDDRGLDRSLLTDQPDEVIHNGVDVIVELIGGIEPAQSLINQSLTSGKPVVTANKQLLASAMASLQTVASCSGVRLNYEASVCAGVPVIRALREGLAGDHIDELCGILNGTCNYILTRMSEKGDSFDDALRDAQQKGFAESDPAADIEGEDAAQKLAILCGVAFGAGVSVEAIPTRGIGAIDLADIMAVRDIKGTFKLVARATVLSEGRIEACVSPVIVKHDHPFAHVRDEQNALIVKGDACGELLFKGAGAGPAATASGVLADVVDVVTRPDPPVISAWHRADVAPPSERTTHYVRILAMRDGQLPDRCQQVFSKCGIATNSLEITKIPRDTQCSRIVLVTQPCTYEQASRAAADLSDGRPTVVAPIWGSRST